MFKIIAFFKIKLLPIICISLTRGKYLHGRIISRGEEVCDHDNSLTQSLLIEVPVPSQKSERSCMYALGVSILPLSTILIFDFGIAPTLRYFVFHLILNMIIFTLYIPMI